MRDVGIGRWGWVGGVAAAVVGSAVAACGPSNAPTATRPVDVNVGWIRPPVVQTASLRGDTLLVTGLAQPNGRVVLRTASEAYGSAVDADGRFEVLAPLAAETVLFTPETQVGQESAASSDRLLIIEGGRGPIALLRAGGPTRRLDGTAALGAVDTDGRAILASGFSAQPVSVAASGGSFLARPDENGQWAALVELDPAGGAIRVGEASWLWPGAGAGAGAGAGGGVADGADVRREGDGWRIDWAPKPGARHVAWLPN